MCTSTSFLVDHSKSYTIAIFGSLLEYFARFAYSPIPPSEMTPLRLFGLVSSLSFLALRGYAMCHCSSNFNHIIQTSSDNANPKQELVTTGPYTFMRHPAYTGWFYYTVSTQILLGNPFCFLGYACVSWKFFKERIPYEEGTLIERFEEYEEYKKRTFVLIPFIDGTTIGELQGTSGVKKD